MARKLVLHWLPLALCTAVLLTGCSGGTNSMSGSNNTGGQGGNPTPTTTNEWAWMSGANSPNQSGFYGTLGVASPNSWPGARMGSVAWTDSSGNLWLFGGVTNFGGDQNDLWQFDPATSEWTWEGGSDQLWGTAVYGTQGTPSTNNIPEARSGAVGWRDVSGNFWLFGGASAYGELNDLWEFSPEAKTWTWVGGSKSGGAAGVYGTQGVAAVGNVPGGRDGAIGWTDSNGNLWLFGGQDATQSTYNDLWEFVPSTKMWTWVSGSSTPNATGVYGTQGVANSANVPASRWGSVNWIDNNGNLWLFGGSSKSEYMSGGAITSDLNDLWEFSPATQTWTWVSGSNTSGTVKAGVYGSEGVAASGNVPGSRSLAVSWIDSSGNLWLIGGQGYDSTGNVNGDLNDLWKFSPSAKQWTWMGGSSTIPSGSNAAAGVYGTLGVAAATNVPGGRDSAVGWTDKNGNFWLFGGEVTLYYNDLWRYDP